MTCKLIFLTLVLIIFGNIDEANGQKSSQLHYFTAIQDTLVSQIARDGTVKGQHVSRAAYTSEQYIRFDSLRRISSVEDMMFLANHKSAAVKVYAFISLLDSKDWEKALQALQLNYKDRTAFYHLFGCIGGIHTVGYFMGINLKISLKNNNITLDTHSQKLFETILAKLPSYKKEKMIANRQEKIIEAQAERVAGFSL